MKNRLRILLTVAILLIALVTAAAGETADDGVLAGAGFTEIGKDGFYIPMPTGEGWQGGEAWGMRGLFAEATRTDAAGWRLTVQGYSQELSDFVQTANDANRYYDSLRFENERNVVMSNVMIGGYTARLATFSYDQQDGTFAAHGGILLYAREMRLLQVRIYSESETGLEETTPVVRMEDLERVAGMVRFAAEEAPIRHSDVELTISIDGNVPVVPAGGTLRLVMNEAHGLDRRELGSGGLRHGLECHRCHHQRQRHPDSGQKCPMGLGSGGAGQLHHL